MNATQHPDVQFFGGRSLVSRLTDLPFWAIQAFADRLFPTPEALAAIDRICSWVGSWNSGGDVVEVDANGVRAVWVQSKSVTAPERTILHVHGGGFVFGTPEMYRSAAVRLSAATNSRVLLFDYRHPPTASVEAMTADCLAVYRWLVRRKSPGRLIVSGDSAGGNLAFGMLAAARDARLPMPAGLVTISAWLDPDHRHSSGPRDALWPPLFAQAAAEWCYGNDGLPRSLRPLELDVSRFPPVLLQAGSTEPLALSNQEMAVRLRRARVPVAFQLWDKQIHVFQLLLGFLPESRGALAEIASFIDDVIGAGTGRRLGVV